MSNTIFLKDESAGVVNKTKQECLTYMEHPDFSITAVSNISAVCC